MIADPNTMLGRYQRRGRVIRCRDWISSEFATLLLFTVLAILAACHTVLSVWTLLRRRRKDST